jgi:hypothetical protein
VRHAKRDQLSLERFGCAFKESTGVFDVDWKHRRAAQASNANIFACLSRVGTTSGPIVLLAIELSSVRPLPNYCYFPFDLKRKQHRDYLSRLTTTGEIRLNLLTGKATTNRTHQLTRCLQLRVAEAYEEALQEYGMIEGNKYDFDSALQLVERHVRIPELLNRLLLEDTLHELSGKIEEAIQTVPNENRELAKRTVRALAEAFLPYYQNNRKAFLENLRHARNGATVVIDLHRMFADDPAGLAKFFSDAMAATFSREQLGILAEQATLVVSLSKLLSLREQLSQSSATEVMPTIPALPAGLAGLFQSMAASGISKDAPRKLFELIGLQVGGKPGRPAKDYSREYDLKASGLSWSKVARRALEDNAELREEFAGRAFQSLSFQEQENLTNRIREGVRSYAQRAGRPFPIGVEEVPDQDDPAEK